MKEIIEKLSSYNIFNYLLPGAIFAYFIEHITPYKVIQTDLIIGPFLYYFIGMVISRLGSLLFEPLLKKMKFITFADYNEFVLASAKDEKINTLSEANNTYRTICALFISLITLKTYSLIAIWLKIPEWWNLYLAMVGLFLLFALAYRKQTNYIVKRIEARNHDNR